MNIDEFKTVGQWYHAMKAEEYSIPLALCHTLSMMIKEKKMTFSEAYNTLMSKNRIKIVNKMFIFDLNDR